MEFRIAACGLALLAGLISQGHAAQSVSAPVLFSQTTAPAGAYYEQNGSNFCGFHASTSSGSNTTASVCRLDFAAAPTGKYLVIEHVACNLVLEGVALADVSLANASGVNDIRLVPLEPTLESQSDTNFYSLNESVLYVTRSVPRIVLHSAGDGFLTMTCQISGHLNVNQ
jgi:hypothetical protein